jgi:hypothetical protein
MRCNPKPLAGAAVTGFAALGLVLGAPAIQVGATSPSQRSPARLELSGGSALAGDRNAPQTKRYRNATWRFALDVPARWHAFPPGPALSPDDVGGPYEVVRFSEKGDRTLMSVYRMPHAPSVAPALASKQVQATLTKHGFSGFVTGEARIGPRRVLTLDCEKRHPGGETWRVRAYLIIDGTLMYVLGFGTPDRATLAGAYDQMAKSFTFEESASS